MARQWVAGAEIARLERTMTAERMRWYADVLETVVAAHGRPVLAGPGIHTDDEVARRNGLPSRVADGMVTGNWLSSLVFGAFGEQMLTGGRFRVRFVRPVATGATLTATVAVQEVARGTGGPAVRANLSCRDETGQECTVGEATVSVDGAEPGDQSMTERRQT